MQMQVSVVIPVRDEELTIQRLLDSLSSQTRAPDEVIITDGGSRDRTLAIIEGYDTKDFLIKLIRSKGAFPGQGRNLGVQAASYNVIAFTDAGIVLNSRWLEKLVEPMERDKTLDVVYGTYEPVLDSFFAECAALAYVPAPVDHGGTRIRIPSIVSSLMKRSVWEAVDGFPPYRAAEDLIFMDKVRRAGFAIAYAPEAVAYWKIVANWRFLFRRFSSYSYHNIIAGWARHWHMGVVRLYAAGLVCVALAILHSPAWLLGLVAGFLARVLRIAFNKRKAFEFRDVFRPKRLVYLGALLLVIDAATMWGAWQWVLRRFREAVA